jgi:hypothetical protein
MNFDQGMRRLAIFAGTLGAIAGGICAYKVLRFVPSERYQHKVFEKLAASDVVKREKSLLLSEKARGFTFDWPLVSELDDTGMMHHRVVFDSKEVQGVPPGSVVEPIEAATSTSQTLTSSGIKAIFWKPDFSVDFLDMQDGGSVSSEPSPSAWLYLLWVALPALGFVMTWGTIRAAGWVVAGFLAQATP